MHLIRVETTDSNGTRTEEIDASCDCGEALCYDESRYPVLYCNKCLRTYDDWSLMCNKEKVLISDNFHMWTKSRNTN